MCIFAFNICFSFYKNELNKDYRSVVGNNYQNVYFLFRIHTCLFNSIEKSHILLILLLWSVCLINLSLGPAVDLS